MSADKFEVVISGVGGVFPECASFNEFHDLLFKGKSGVTIDNRRWPVGKWICFDHSKVKLPAQVLQLLGTPVLVVQVPLLVWCF